MTTDGGSEITFPFTDNDFLLPVCIIVSSCALPLMLTPQPWKLLKEDMSQKFDNITNSQLNLGLEMLENGGGVKWLLFF